ncbi:MAG: hypothetical protein AB1416_09380, partial [Actinomycetota bacterium]
MLRLPPGLQADLDALDPELRAAARAIGAGLRAELSRMRPALSRGDGGSDVDAELVSLDLEHEGGADAVSLSACLAAHRAYVTERGHPDGVSLGALAIARLLVWGTRASLLGAAPRVRWIGPPGRRPDLADDQVALSATAVASVGGVERRAGAVAVVQKPAAA